jgi:transposase-like protein
MAGLSKHRGRGSEFAPPGRAAQRSIRPAGSHSFEVRRKAVLLRMEKGFPVELVDHEVGVGPSILSKWLKVYGKQGEVGLLSHAGRRGSP